MNLHPFHILYFQSCDHLILPVGGLCIVGFHGRLVALDGLDQRCFDRRDLAMQHQPEGAHQHDQNSVHEEPCSTNQSHQIVIRVTACIVIPEHHGESGTTDDERCANQLATTHMLVQPEMSEDHIRH